MHEMRLPETITARDAPNAMQVNRTTQIVCTIALLAALLWLGTNTRFYTEALISTFFGLALASVLIIHPRVRPSKNRRYLGTGQHGISTSEYSISSRRLWYGSPSLD
jgi:amino acid permease